MLVGSGSVRLPLEQWSARDAATFLSQAGLNPEAWEFAESLGEDVFSEYWKTVPAHSGFDLDQRQLEFACQRLMEAGRPESAISILSSVTFDKGPCVTVNSHGCLDCMPGVETVQSRYETS